MLSRLREMQLQLQCCSKNMHSREQTRSELGERFWYFYMVVVFTFVFFYVYLRFFN